LWGQRIHIRSVAVAGIEVAMAHTIYNFRVFCTMDMILKCNASDVAGGELAPLDTGVQLYA
jgi:hypothetical protein